MEIKRLLCGEYVQNTYLVLPKGRADCFLVDAGDDAEKIAAAVARSGRALTDILLTHGHFDHMLAADALRRETGAKLWIDEGDAEMLSGAMDNQYRGHYVPFAADAFYPRDGKIEICGTGIQTIHTPGHTPGGTCFLLGDVLFTGDTLFARGYGRFDMEGGSAAILRQSLQKIFRMFQDKNPRVLAGHDMESPLDDIRAFFGIR